MTKITALFVVTSINDVFFNVIILTNMMFENFVEVNKVLCDTWKLCIFSMILV